MSLAINEDVDIQILIILILTENKSLLCKAILKPIWGVQLPQASDSNIEILERFQNKYLGIIVNAPYYVTNDALHHDLNVLYVKNEIKRLSQRYADRMEERSNILAINFTKQVETT